MSSDLDRPMRRERRKNFRLGWHLPATIYDVGRHLARIIRRMQADVA
jgi:hypothetical protein